MREIFLKPFPFENKQTQLQNLTTRKALRGHLLEFFIIIQMRKLNNKIVQLIDGRTGTGTRVFISFVQFFFFWTILEYGGSLSSEDVCEMRWRNTKGGNVRGVQGRKEGKEQGLVARKSERGYAKPQGRGGLFRQEQFRREPRCVAEKMSIGVCTSRWKKESKM